MWLCYIFGGLSLAVALFAWAISDPAKDDDYYKNLEDKHVVITGGSSGIGLSTAKLLASKGAHVTIIARDQEKLNKAKVEIEGDRKKSTQKVLAYSVDVSNYAAVEEVVKKIAAEHNETIDALICSAGVARPGRFLELPIDQFEGQMKINYLGCVYPSRAVVPFMLKKKRGRIIFISSLAGLVGVFGYTAYSPTKYALRGLAESLHMELRPHGIRVSLSFPPDVDTPQLAGEAEFKPPETKAISAGAGVFKPEALARDLVGGLQRWRFHINTGLDGFALGSLAGALTPSASFTQSITEILLLPLLRIVGLFTNREHNNICLKYAKEKKD